MSIHAMIHKGFEATHTACCVIVSALLLASCSSPPKPPSVDESTKRPVNAKAAVKLKACQGDLSRSTILVSELARAGVVTAALTKPNLNGAGTGVATSNPTVEAASGNLVAVVPFGLGSASWGVEQADAAALVRRARSAAVVMIRGRTDASGDSLQETALARRRAESAADFLHSAGVPREKLRLTWQGAGDPVAGLGASRGGQERGQSRRVEIEFYASTPMLVSVRMNGASATDRARSDTVASL